VRYLLDTNIVAELRKGRRASLHVRRWFEPLDGDDLLISVLTVGEIRNGIERVRRRDPMSALALERWLGRLRSDFSDRILPIDDGIAEEWGRLGLPDPIPVVDGLIAATALRHRLTVATRNVKDMARTGVPFVNPFDGRN
jgi:predicted nucleic acid-binding protein